jgi:NAD dependent epimerase/dehydratase family enzyme
MMLGEMAMIVTEGSRVSNEKIAKAGFEFPELEEAVGDLLKL